MTYGPQIDSPRALLKALEAKGIIAEPELVGLLREKGVDELMNRMGNEESTYETVADVLGERGES